MKTETGYSELYEEALRVAAIVHRCQNRKGCDVPYITHPVHTSIILLNLDFPVQVAIAALLHDIVEDQGYDLSKIRTEFGSQVADIVAALSERKTDAQGEKRPWEDRKKEALEHLRNSAPEVAMVKAADTLHNARCIARDARQEGPSVWQRFTRGPRPLLSYYRQITQVVRERLGQHQLVDELEKAMKDLAQVMIDIPPEDEELCKECGLVVREDVRIESKAKKNPLFQKARKKITFINRNR